MRCFMFPSVPIVLVLRVLQDSNRRTSRSEPYSLRDRCLLAFCINLLLDFINCFYSTALTVSMSNNLRALYLALFAQNYSKSSSHCRLSRITYLRFGYNCLSQRSTNPIRVPVSLFCVHKFPFLSVVQKFLCRRIY